MTTCRHCGWELPAGALFCGECGRAVSPAAAVVEEVVPERNDETGSLDRFGREWDSWASETWVDQAEPQEPREPQEPQEPAATSAPEEAEPVDSARTDAIDLSLFEPTTPGLEPAPLPPPAPETRITARAPAPPLLPVPELPGAERASTRSDPDEGAIDLESTRLVSRSPHSRHVLQFSTGESVTVTGSGLVGRNPAMEPGEYVDQLVTLVDGGRSVSKTHLEFGQEQGRFWVSDRYSTNGTVVRPPDEVERRCEPGRRYLVSRGTRVDIGEQFFVVS